MMKLLIVFRLMLKFHLFKLLGRDIDSFRLLSDMKKDIKIDQFTDNPPLCGFYACEYIGHPDWLERIKRQEWSIDKNRCSVDLGDTPEWKTAGEKCDGNKLSFYRDAGDDEPLWRCGISFYVDTGDDEPLWKIIDDCMNPFEKSCQITKLPLQYTCGNNQQPTYSGFALMLNCANCQEWTSVSDCFYDQVGDTESDHGYVCARNKKLEACVNMKSGLSDCKDEDLAKAIDCSSCCVDLGDTPEWRKIGESLDTKLPNWFPNWRDIGGCDPQSYVGYGDAGGNEPLWRDENCAILFDVDAGGEEPIWRTWRSCKYCVSDRTLPYAFVYVGNPQNEPKKPN